MLKRYLGLAIAVGGFVLSAVICGWLLQAYMPGYGPGMLFTDAGLIQKLLMMLIVLLHLPILVLGLLALIDGKGQFSLPLLVMGIVPMVMGGLAALYGVMTIQQALARVGPVSFAVTAPGYAEAAFAVAMGCFAGGLAMGARLLGDRRR